MTILGIETSCDETALALIETREHGGTFECRVINSLVHSQAELHSAYGGVYPSLAKREHGKNLVPLLHKLLAGSGHESKEMGVKNGSHLFERELKSVIESFRAELQHRDPDLLESVSHAEFLKKKPTIDAIAVTEGPGLEPTLWVGINFARILSALWNIPIIPVNHMEGHIVGSLLGSDAPHGAWQRLKDLELPSVALLISGGHTELVRIDSDNKYSILGQTKDDAAGEAFDKVARLLGLPYPGGPHVSKLSNEAREQNIPVPNVNGEPISLPRPMLGSGDLDFSFSGLKTAVLYAVRDATKAGITDETFKKGLAREFEDAVVDVLQAKLRSAIERIGAKSIILGGGVSANHVLRQSLEGTAAEYGIPIFMPSRHISGDNALMIAIAGALHKNTDNRPLKAEGTKRLG